MKNEKGFEEYWVVGKNKMEDGKKWIALANREIIG